MRFTDKDLAGLVARQGAKITARERPPVKPEPPEAPEPAEKDDGEQTELLAELLRTQQRLADLFEKLAAVKAPQISVELPKAATLTAKPVTRWVFEHEYDSRGDCLRTIATASPATASNQ